MQAAGAVFLPTGSRTIPAGFIPALLKLLGNEEAMMLVRQDDRIAEEIAGQPPAGLLEQRLLPSNFVKLLG